MRKRIIKLSLAYKQARKKSELKSMPKCFRDQYRLKLHRMVPVLKMEDSGIFLMKGYEKLYQ